MCVGTARRVTLAALIESLTEAKAAGNLSRRLRVLTHPALLVGEEIMAAALIDRLAWSVLGEVRSSSMRRESSSAEAA